MYYNPPLLQISVVRRGMTQGLMYLIYSARNSKREKKNGKFNEKYNFYFCFALRYSTVLVNGCYSLGDM